MWRSLDVATSTLTTVLDQAKAHSDLEEATKKASGETYTATQKQEAYVTELQSVAQTLDPDSDLRKQLDAYIFTLASTPTDKHTDFQVETEDALRKWDEYVKALENGTPYQIETIFNVTTPGPRAAGGPVDAGTPYVVGEVGPELFVPKVPGVIIPNYAMQQGEWSRASEPQPSANEPLIGSLTLVTATPHASAQRTLGMIGAARRMRSAKR